MDDFAVLPDGRIIAATVLGFVDELDPSTGRSRPLTGGHLGATSARVVPDGRVVVSTMTGRVVTIDGA